MELIIDISPIKRVSSFNLEITDEDFFKMNLKDHEQWLLKECEQSNKVSDKLLALEMLARKIERADEVKHNRKCKRY